MKLLDKLKNALFEEEYVEVEEKPKAPKKEKPIAKKIVLPEQKKEVKQSFIEEEEKEEIIEEPKKDFKFPAILEDDFIEMEHPKEEEKKEEVKLPPKEEKQDIPIYSYQEEKPKKESHLYGGKQEINLDMPTYGGSYEKKQEKKVFHPSPIISPIYGVIEEGESKAESEPKHEIRLTSSYSSRKLDVDAVRAKAYGDTDDIFEEELKPSETKTNMEKETIEEDNGLEQEDTLLMDITDTSPTVPKVTVGDAEEYFQDLGLEYNIDYKDASHERATGRRVDLRKEKKNEKPKEDGLEDNLFELIDSMYEEKEGE